MAATDKLGIWNTALQELGTHLLIDTTTVNTRQAELNTAWLPAIRYVLAQADWQFARRRSTLTPVADASFPPFTYRYAKPSDYLRKCWIRLTADDDQQTDHAEIAAVFYGFNTSPLLEYVSDHADNYDPLNWPPHFARALGFYLALLVAPKLARAGDNAVNRINAKFQTAMSDASTQEAVFLTNVQVPVVRHPVMRRAMQFLAQELAGSVTIHAHADRLRWQMNRSWDQAVKYSLEQGAWNFATKRAYFHDGVAGDSLVPTTDGGYIEGYSVSPADDPATPPSISGFEYGYPLPDDFLHKIWIKIDPRTPYECGHQIIADSIYTDQDPCIMEYIAENAFTTSPTSWPATFMEVVASYLALLVSPEIVVDQSGGGRARVNQPQIRDRLQAIWMAKLSDARTKDAIQQEPRVIPSGRFVRARTAGATSPWMRR